MGQSTWGVIDKRTDMWLNKKNWDINAAKAEISNYVSNWPRDSGWLYCVDFLENIEKEWTNEFKFRVRWSIPKAEQPIPVASASIYFTYKFHNIVPDHEPAEMSIQYENNTRSETCGEFVFKEVFLRRILSAKAKALESQAFNKIYN